MRILYISGLLASLGRGIKISSLGDIVRAVVAAATRSRYRVSVTSDISEPELGIVPNLHYWWDPTKEAFPLSIFEHANLDGSEVPTVMVEIGLIRQLQRNENTVVYSMEGSGSGLVVKYRAFCALGPDKFPDDLAREAYFLRKLNREAPEIVPRIKMLSDPILIPEYASGAKLWMNPNECPVRRPPMVRYIVMEELGETLHQILEMKKRIPMGEAASFTLQIVRLIRRIHDLNIVHANLNLGNVALRAYEAPLELKLLDFTNARRGSVFNEPDAIPSVANVICDGSISHWESSDMNPSFRDDIFRAIQMMAIMVHGLTYYEQFAQMCNKYARAKDFEAYYAIKSRLNIFDTKLSIPTKGGGPTRDYYYELRHTGILVSQEHDIGLLLTSMLAEVRSPRSLAERPNYAFLEHSLVRIMTITDGPETPKSRSFAVVRPFED